MGTRDQRAQAGQAAGLMNVVTTASGRSMKTEASVGGHKVVPCE